MEKMPFQDVERIEDVEKVIATARLASGPRWRHALPMLQGRGVMLRDLRLTDASALLVTLARQEVARFISPPPTTVDGFERFIAWSHRERAAGTYACYAVVPRETDDAIGIFQLRSLEPGFAAAEWGFAIGAAFWGSGVFASAAEQVVDFAFAEVGVHRLEARAVTSNGRGNGALRKVGAVQEGVLRRSFHRNGEYLDQALWTIVDEDWRRYRAA